MKKTARILALLLSVMMLLSAFAACGDATADPSPSVSTSDGAAVIEPIDVVLPDRDGAPMDLSIYVPKVEGLSDTFQMGADVSTVLAEEASGVVYYDYDGNEQDLFVILAQSGITSIRVRVWNDPFDANGNGYGAGNCDINTALEIGKRAAAAGLNLVVDFHYSDFWADPAKQMCPKAWVGMNKTEITDALYQFTKDSLQLLKDAGINVIGVQIGNETMGGMAGINNSWTRVCHMFNAGSKAVREVLPEAKVILHFTNPNNGKLPEKAQSLFEHEVDYDVFATSYYPAYHGTVDNMIGQLKTIIDTYDKEVMVAELAWGYTMEDGDGFSNSFGGSTPMDYLVSVQGQANSISDVIVGLATLGDKAIGVYYWEPAWVPVNDIHELEGTDWNNAYAANEKLWEQYGTGWATSYAADYDPEDAGAYFGGNAWDNMTLFDFTGHPNESLLTFAAVYTGTTVEPSVQSIPDVTVIIQKGLEFVAPETVDALYTDMTRHAVAVEWNADEVAAVDTSAIGDFSITGKTADGASAKLSVQVKTLNLLTNPGFESGSGSWDLTTNCETSAFDGETPLAGDKCYHFWNSSEADVLLTQTLTVENDGLYMMSASLQGGETGVCLGAYVFITVDGETIKKDFDAPMMGWKAWEKCTVGDVELKAGQTVTVGIYVDIKADGWGTIDEMEFCKQ